MHIAEGVRGALDTIRAYPLRAFFTVFGTLTGVAFLVAVITILGGMSNYVETQVIGRFYGYNTVTVERAPPRKLVASAAERRSRSRYRRLTLDDARWLEERMQTPGVISATWSASAPAAAGSRKLAGVRVTGTTPSHFYVNGVRVAEGRPFTEHEAERGLPVMVIGQDVADRLFPGASAMGRSVLLAGIPYRVVGVLARQGKLFTISMDRTAIIPGRSPLNGVVVPRDVAEVISFKVSRGTHLPAAMTELEGWMRLRKRLRPGEENEFSITTSEQALASWGKVSRVMMVAVPGLIGISLVVAGLVIMNIMLVSVTERTYEIGVRKALGARSRDVLLQFLVEAGALSGIGGLLGVAVGLCLAWVVTTLTPLPARVAPWSAVVGLALGIGVGVAAGLYPARRAARLDPITALGHE